MKILKTSQSIKKVKQNIHIYVYLYLYITLKKKIGGRTQITHKYLISNSFVEKKQKKMYLLKYYRIIYKGEFR